MIGLTGKGSAPVEKPKITFGKEGVPMGFAIRNFVEGKNKNISVTDTKGCFAVAEYDRDVSVTPGTAVAAYFSSEMEVHKRQLVCDVSKARNGVMLQAGAMQWMAGNIGMVSGVKGVGDMLGKAFKGKVTGESASKPEYTGNGVVVCEPTYRHLIICDISEWNGAVVLEDGLFLACEKCLQHSIAARRNFSSAIAGGEGFFNLRLSGSSGLFVVESNCPMEDLIEVELKDDVLKIDGNYAIMWSDALEFTVERSAKTLIGSAVSGEGLVNVYRGTGKVWMEPLAKMPDF